MTKVVVVEDFPPVARRLARMVEALLPKAKVTIFGCLSEARDSLDKAGLDLLLLDLNLHGRDGFSLLRDCVARAFHTIVVSANTERALEAFEYGVLYFVPKPVQRERLQKALERITGPPDPHRPETRFFSVRKTGEIHLIDATGVEYIKGAGKYTELVLEDGTTALHDKSLERLTALLRPPYMRIHKSYLIDIRHIKSLLIHGGGKYQAVLHSGGRLPVGRSRYPGLRDALV